MINSWIIKEQFVFVDFVVAIEVLVLFFVLLLRIYTVLRALLWRTQLDFDEPLNPNFELSIKQNEQLRPNVNIIQQDILAARVASQTRKARASSRRKGTVTPRIKTKFRSRSCSPSDSEQVTNNSTIDASETSSRKSSFRSSKKVTVLCSRQKVFKEDIESIPYGGSQKLDKKNGKFINSANRKSLKSSQSGKI